jgi:hypothetical protein
MQKQVGQQWTDHAPWLLTKAAERRFEVRSCKPTSRGRPSSVKQLRTLRSCELRVLMAHYHRPPFPKRDFWLTGVWAALVRNASTLRYTKNLAGRQDWAVQRLGFSPVRISRGQDRNREGS